MNNEQVRKVSVMNADKFKQYCFAIGLGRCNKVSALKSPVVDRNKASNVLGISDKTIDRYLRYGCSNQTVINLLQTLAFGCNQGGSWAGWRLDSEYLTSPYGWRIDPKYLKQLWRLRDAENYAERRIKELECAIADMHRINQTGNNKKIIGLANELLDAINHKSKIYDTYIDLTKNNVVELKTG